MRTVKATDNNGWIFTFRLTSGSMREIKCEGNNESDESNNPYRLRKKELNRALDVLESGRTSVSLEYYIGIFSDIDLIHAVASLTRDSVLVIGCMTFSPAETRKLIEWVRE